MEDLFEAARKRFFGTGSSAQTETSSVSKRTQLFREFTQIRLPDESKYPVQAAVLVGSGI